MIYFVECCGKIKIGFTGDVKRRLMELATAAPLPPTLIGTVPGDYRDEAKFHMALAEYRSNGEWFDDCREVRAVVEKALAGGGAIYPEPRPLLPDFGQAIGDQDDELLEELRKAQQRFEYLVNSKLTAAVKAARQAEIDTKAERGSITAELVEAASYRSANAVLRKNFTAYTELTEAAFKASGGGVPLGSFIERVKELVAETESAYRAVIVRKSEYALDFGAAA